MAEAAIARACELIADFEGLKLHAYPDPASPLALATPRAGWGMRPASEIFREIHPGQVTLDGSPWTVGYGATGSDITHATEWTQEIAEEWLIDRVLSDHETVSALVSAPLTDSQTAAVLSLVYNVGRGAFSTSTLLRQLNARDYKGASAQFLKWVYAGGRKSRGLEARRLREREVFDGPVLPRVL